MSMCDRCIKRDVCPDVCGGEYDLELCAYFLEGTNWIPCSKQLPTEDNGERVIAHICIENSVCETIFIPWRSVEFEYQAGHVDAWLPIPKYVESEVEE